MSKKTSYEIAISGCGEGNLVMKGNRCIRQITAVIFKSVIFLSRAQLPMLQHRKGNYMSSDRAGDYQVSKALRWVGGRWGVRGQGTENICKEVIKLIWLGN